MRPPRRVTFRSVVALAAVAMVAAGCGLTDEGARPGVAAEVEGQRLDLSTVDRAVQDYCELLAVNEQASPSPTAVVRAQFALGWMQAIAAEQLAEENDIPLPPEAIDPGLVEEYWGELGTIDEDNYETFEWLTWLRNALSSPVEQLGAKLLLAETGQTSNQQDALNRGAARINEWLEENDPELNPVFGEYNAETGFFDGDTLSVPVSGEARASRDTGNLTAEQINALPAEQRCGPKTAAAPQVPGA